VSSILVVNAGSTSLKLSIVDEAGMSRRIGSLEEAAAEVGAAAHRVVHGGAGFSEPVVVDADVKAALEELAELAPLHNRPALAAVDETMRLLPHIPHVAVFDTAFHRTIPPEASTYALPARWREDWGVRRFGFHGLSVEWAAEHVPVPRLVVCHLGGGCSVTAVLEGRSVDTTMGFSPLEGVPMGTRSGSIDVEIVLHLLRTRKLELEEIERSLESESGLLGLSGESARVEELERSSSEAAQLALDVFSHRVAAAVAEMTTALGGLDALVFTAGIGEGSPSVRRSVCGRLDFLGLELDEIANAAAAPDVDVNVEGAAVRIVVLHAHEDVVAARAARALLSRA
jgi:acetate kinase